MIMRSGMEGGDQTPGDLILEKITEVNPDALFIEGFNAAIIAMDAQRHVPIYDMARVCELLVMNDGMTDEEAEEFFHTNMAQAYLGKHTPLFVFSINPIEPDNGQPTHLPSGRF